MPRAGEGVHTDLIWLANGERGAKILESLPKGANLVICAKYGKLKNETVLQKRAMLLNFAKCAKLEILQKTAK